MPCGPAAHSHLWIQGDMLVTGSDDNTLRVWSIEQGKLLFTLVGHSGGVWTSQLSTDGKYIISGSTDRTVKVWSAKDGSLIHTLHGHTSTVRCMSLCRNMIKRVAVTYQEWGRLVECREVTSRGKEVVL
ncbi:hypothetical protein Y032_0012g1604 [Ancylostoma ceylanicum]|nr:hypothetical protein Y032_0012g1604 [Ancylostoma ceylanicum]